MDTEEAKERPGREGLTSILVAAGAGILLGACGSGEPSEAVADSARSPRVPRVIGQPDIELDLDVDLTGVRVDPGMEVVDTLPAGALADCSLLVVTLDTTRADRLGCYGNREIRTPHLDGLAKQGVLFSAATAVTPVTLPSHASLFTGLYPPNHGARANGLFRLHESHETLAERLRDHGFRTGAFVSSFVLDAQFGLSQGFDRYDDEIGAGDPNRAFRTRTGDRTTDRALAWLDEQDEGRFFLWVHYIDPHHDYAPPSPFRERYATNPYDGEIAFVDAQVGRLLASLEERGLSETCLVVVVGDHGEGLGEHSERTHGYLLYESTLRVPMLMACGSRLGGGVHFPRPVSQVDLVPSILSLLGIDAPECDGVSLTEAHVAERPLYFETLTGTFDYGWEALLGVSLGSNKYIHSSSPELFDLGEDPRESRNLLAKSGERASELQGMLSDMYGAELADAIDVTPTVRPSTQDLEELQALGYVGGGVEGSAEGLPREMIRLLDRVERGKRSEHTLEENVAELEAVLAESPDFYPAWKGLGEVYVRHRELEAAADAYVRCLRLKPGTPMDLFSLAAVRQAQGRHEEALRLIEPVLEEYPGYLRARHLSATLLGALGRWRESAAQLRTVFERDPDYQEHLCTRQMIDAYTRIGKVGELHSILREHLDHEPGATGTRLLFAKHASVLGDAKAAEALLREGLKHDPQDKRILGELAVLLASSTDESVRDIEAAIALLEPFAAAGAEDPRLMYTLCALYGSSGRPDEAMALARRARALALEAGDTELVQAFDRRMGGGAPPAGGIPPR